MRTREKSYKDYGLSFEDVKMVKNFCYRAEKERQDQIKFAMSELDPYVAPYVFYSLVHGLSYHEMNISNYIYMAENTFYGHRRKAIFLIYKKILKK